MINAVFCHQVLPAKGPRKLLHVKVFVNGKKVRGALTFDQMKALIEPQIT